MNAPKLLARTMLGVAAAAALTATGCSAGQVTQTDTTVAAVPGNTAEVGAISLQDMMVQFNDLEGYAAGETAPLVVRIFNNATDAPDTLIAVESPAAEAVTITDGKPISIQTEEPEQPGDEELPGDGQDEQQNGEEPGTEPTAEPEPEFFGQTEIAVEVAAAGYVMLVPDQDGLYLQLEGLAEDIRPGGIIEVTFTFAKAGSVTVDVPMGLPLDEQEREHAEIDDAEEGH